MNGPAPGRPLFALFWRLYILLGVVSIGVGGYLFGWPRQTVGAPAGVLEPIRIVGLVLIVFGVVRIGNALFQLWRLRQRSTPAPAATPPRIVDDTSGSGTGL
ncbi:MAG TPA: hypothetical protein VKT77_11645 [Chthonomonadaceae bacterium]|nr:hypothetical protein [Chthonomonadaceae bacterium]